MISVSSSNVSAIGHDGDASVLRVEYTDGSIYQYHGVPPAQFRGLLRARSKGGYLHRHIKGHYPFTKL